jgi:predicted MFS family arabinose efflux permease
VHLPGYLRELGAREAEIGTVMAASSLSAIVLVPWLGLVMDSRGRRGVIAAASSLNLLAMSLYLAVDSIGPALYAIRILHGIAGGALYASLFTYAADQVPESRRTEGLALFGASGLVPIALGALLGDLLLRAGSYRVIFAVGCGCAASAAALAWTLSEPPRPRSGWEPPRGLRAALRQSDLVPVWCMTAAFFTATALVFTFLKTYVLSTGLGSVGGFFSAYAVLAIGLRVFLGGLPDRLGPERVLGCALASYALGLLVLGSGAGAPAVVSAGLLCGAGHGYVYPILFCMVVRRARASERGTALALYTAIEEACYLLGSPALGWAIEQSGYFATFSATGVALLTSGALLLLWDRSLRSAASA